MRRLLLVILLALTFTAFSASSASAASITNASVASMSQQAVKPASSTCYLTWARVGETAIGTSGVLDVYYGLFFFNEFGVGPRCPIFLWQATATPTNGSSATSVNMTITVGGPTSYYSANNASGASTATSMLIVSTSSSSVLACGSIGIVEGCATYNNP